MKDIPTALSPLGGLGGHTRKKNTFLVKKLENFNKIPEIFGSDGEYTTAHPQGKFPLDICYSLILDFYRQKLISQWGTGQ